MVRYRKKLVSLPIRLRNQKWDTYQLSGTQLWLRLPARVRLWPSTGAGRGQYAGSALLRNEAVHTVLHGSRAVSCLVFFVLAKLATDSSTTHAGRTSRRLLASWITSQLDFIDLNRSYPLSWTRSSHSFCRETACVKLIL